MPVAPNGSQADARPDTDADLGIFAFSLDALADLKVITVSKKDDTVIKTPAAVTVLTADDIVRSGHQSIPELLRMVPGLQVAKVNSNIWAITARGFNGQFASRLLVLIDGRSVYTPTFGGTYWDVQDTVLEDIERIEVVKGPGGTLWGVNAVNGIVNIVTKSAAHTQGVLVTAGAGNEEKGFASFRYGGQLSERATFRVYGKYLNRDAAIGAEGHRAHDPSDAIRAGFRVDWAPSDADQVTFQGDVYDGHSSKRGFSVSPTEGPFFQNETQTVRGTDLIARWTRHLNDTSRASLQLYYDRTERYQTLFDETRDTFDLDFTHDIQPFERHHVVWGFGCRYIDDNMTNTFALRFEPEDFAQKIFSAFLHDEITLQRDRLKLVVGAKLQRNDFTGLEYQPSARLIYTPDEQQSAWIALTRAVNIPTRGFTHMSTAFNTRNDKLRAEYVVASEAGYRHRPHERVFLDYSFFYNKYYDAISAEGPQKPPVWGNSLAGESYGGEMAAHWRPNHVIGLSAGYTYLQIDMRSTSATSLPSRETGIEGASPRSKLHLIARMNPRDDLEVDVSFYFVDRVPNNDIPSYVRSDLGLAWRPSDHLDISLVGQNLLKRSHPEMGGTTVVPTEVQRSVLAKVTGRF